MPLQVGLRVINSQRPEDRPLLPILKKGDLRELEASTPCLHLHSINMEHLSHLSNLQSKGIHDVIVERLQVIQ